MGKLFGTDGVRGVANRELTAELAYKLGRYGAIVLAGEKHHKPKIIVGTDTRISCPMLECALISGICSAGADVLVCEVIPTPGIAYLVRKYKCDAGVVISASHNSYEYNGIKFFDSEGYKLPDNIENSIEAYILGDMRDSGFMPVGEEVGHRYICENAYDDYITYLRKELDINLFGLKIAIDCANGATSDYAPELFRSLGAEVFCICHEPDGININKDCGSTHPERLCQEVVNNNCDLGFAFDGDGDRMLAVDQYGKVIDGDVIMAVIAGHLKKINKLNHDTLVVTVMSNLGLDLFAASMNINIAKTKVGDRYVIEEMRKYGYSVGGEQSGHIILLDHSTSGDGMLSALMLLKVIVETNKTVAELSNVMRVLPQVLRGVKVKREFKNVILNDADLLKESAVIENELAGKGRVLIRASGTEPLIRVMIEGENIDKITQMCEKLIGIIRDKYPL